MYRQGWKEIREERREKERFFRVLETIALFIGLFLFLIILENFIR